VRSRLFMTTALAGIAGAIWSGTSRVTLRFDVKRGLSLRCWLFGHEDWVRRVPGRLYLECLDCGRETPGWTTSRNESDDGTTGARAQPLSDPPPDCSGSDPSLAELSGRLEQPAANQGQMPIAA
jgi:hypothetical protein